MSVRLSSRVQRIRPSPTVSVTALAARLRAAGRDVIALSVGEPDFPTPQHIRDAAAEAIHSGQTKYTPVDGSPALKAAVIRKFGRDNGLAFSPEEILVSNGGKQSCFNACQALFERGDEVIVPAPYWVSYPDMVRLAGAEPVIVNTQPEAGFRMSQSELAAAITDQTRGLILNSPCNPTGNVYAFADWQRLGTVLAEHPNIFVITDDIYEHIYWGKEPFCSLLAACPELRDRVLTVNGVSKAYAMTGWRIGYAAGPTDVIRAMTTIQSQSTTSASSISQIAAEAALDGDQTAVTEMCAAFRERHDHVVSRLNELPGVDCAPCDGTFYVFPDVGSAIDALGMSNDVEFCEVLLEKHNVALVPGSAFGAANHIRLSFAASLEQLDAALDRISDFIK